MRAFLSHSSKDKKSYVDIVAEGLGKKNCVYDRMTFEEGEKTSAQIDKWIEYSDIFVLFISEEALESEWVRKELELAEEIFYNNKTKECYPVIIDYSIKYSDERIPEWLRKNYNIQYIENPRVITRRIVNKLRRLAFNSNEYLKNQSNIFVGRNNLIEEFERRNNNYYLEPLKVVIAAGIEGVGRRALIKKCFCKINRIDSSYEPLEITLNEHESIEDFIMQVYSQGISKGINITNLLEMEMEEKINLACRLINDIYCAREVLLIEDKGCIVNHRREVVEWFRRVLCKLEDIEEVAIGIAAKYRARVLPSEEFKYLTLLDVHELNKDERMWLLQRHLKNENIILQTEQLVEISRVLTGYPEQIFYLVDMIKHNGIMEVRDNLNYIREYSNKKVKILLEEFEEDKDAMDFLAFLAEFDFISYNLLYELVNGNEKYIEYLKKYIARAICEEVGAEKEYIRLNDVIKDYVARMLLKVPSDIEEKIKLHINEFQYDFENEDSLDISDYTYTIKKALIYKKDIDIKYLVPSHYLKTMKELYDRRGAYETVIQLADKALEQESKYDSYIVKEIRYFLCISLARKRNTSRLFEEVKKIERADREFILGFYYRITGQQGKAVEHLQYALKERKEFSRARRELVQLYLYLEDYERATSLAKENYEDDKNKTNIYHMQAYFVCLINNKGNVNLLLLQQILDNMKAIQSEKAEEMYLSCKAQYLGYIENKENDAFNTIDSAIEKYHNVIYPILTKLSLCLRFDRLDEMEDILDGYFDGLADKSDHFKNYQNKMYLFKAQYLSRKGNKEEAERVLRHKLKGYPDELVEKLIAKL